MPSAFLGWVEADPGPRGLQVGWGGTQDPIHILSSSPDLSTAALLSPRLRGGKRTAVDRDRRSSSEGHNHESAGRGIEHSRLLQPSLPRSEGYRRASSCLDISCLNKFVDCPHFQMETVRSVHQCVRDIGLAQSTSRTRTSTYLYTDRRGSFYAWLFRRPRYTVFRCSLMA